MLLKQIIIGISMFRLVSIERSRFFVFVVINFILGGLGILLPCLKAARDSLSVGTAWEELLRGGNGYTFAAAVLSAAFAFVIGDFMERQRTSFNALRAFALVVYILYMLWLVFLVTPHFQNIPPWSSTVQSSAPSGTAVDPWQARSLVVGIIFSAWLFCLQHSDAHDQYFDALKDKQKNLVERAQNARGSDDIKM